MKRWYVIHCQRNDEQKAVFNLRNQGYKVYFPYYMKVRRHARRVEHVKAPLFPRYIFVEMDLETSRWHPIRSTVGVSGLVKQGNLPVPVPEGVVEEIQARQREHGTALPVWSFKEGDKVKITNGALFERVGLFHTIDDNQRVVMLLKLLGREIKIRVPREDVQVCA